MGRFRRWWSSVSSWLVPLAIVGLGGIDLAENGSLSSEGAKATFPGPIGVHAGFLLLVSVPLYWRKSHPLVVSLVVSAATVAWGLSMFNPADQPPLEPALAMMAALFALAGRAEGRQLVVGTAVAGSLIFSLEIRGEIAGQGVGNVFPALLFFTLAWVLGRVLHHHRQVAFTHQDRADRLEQEQETRARHAAEMERVRIARELHDVIAHGLSVIVVQAAAERRALEAGRGSPRAVLESVENTGRQTMAELRRLLGVLRKDNAEVSLSPPPSLSHLPQLIAQLADAGIEVAASTEGAANRIPPGVDLSAYRIVQECLTNVAKHAHARHATVHIVCRSGSVAIEVSDDGNGPPPNPDGPGFGLIGMRERAAVYGGDVRAGPLDGGGYRICAVLRYDADELALP